MIEKDFVTEGLKRTKIDEFLESKLERAGYGGMDVQKNPLGTMVVVYAERPGMVIGRGGKTVRSITDTLREEYSLDNPQVEVKEVNIPELNPKIQASKIASMLQRGMHFRRVAYSTIRRIMGAGAQGVEVTISGKIRGSRSATAKFVEGYIKKCGEPSIRLVKQGFSTVQLKPGVLGIFVRIMPPDADLPDKVDILPPKIEESIEESIEEPVEESNDTNAKDHSVVEDIEELEKLESTDENVDAQDIEDIEDIEEIDDVDESVELEDIEDLEEVEDSQGLEDVETSESNKPDESTGSVADELEDIKDIDDLEKVDEEEGDESN
jgi:small subunit ribosomal protein S3